MCVCVCVCVCVCTHANVKILYTEICRKLPSNIIFSIIK